MKYSICLLLALVAGCVPAAPTTIDVTNDARFQAGYRAGQIYQLRVDGYLARTSPTAPWELWTAADLQGQIGIEIRPVPAGATVRIEKLGYLFNSEHPPIPGETTEAVLAYGTLTFADGKTWPGEVVILPALHDPTLVAGTTLLVYPVDGEFLKEVK